MRQSETWQNPDEDENGIDLERLRRNLAMTPEERIEQHRRVFETVLELCDAGKITRRKAYRILHSEELPDSWILKAADERR